MNAPTIPYADQIACLERELGMRRRVYPGLVRGGRMTQEAADLEMARMKAALATIERVAAQEPILGGGS